MLVDAASASPLPTALGLFDDGPIERESADNSIETSSATACVSRSNLHSPKMVSAIGVAQSIYMIRLFNP